MKHDLVLRLEEVMQSFLNLSDELNDGHELVHPALAHQMALAAVIAYEAGQEAIRFYRAETTGQDESC